MDLLTRFRTHLAQTNADVFSEALPGHTSEMAKTAQALRKWAGSGGNTAKDERGIAVAVAAFLKSGEIPGYRDAKYLCFGVATPHPNTQRRIIEDEGLLHVLLNHVQTYREQPKKFRRCYQGLFRGYLRYPGHRIPNETGKTCWRSLRAFLAEHAGHISTSKPELDWTMALGRHMNLLEENPCEPYGKRLLSGDRTVIGELSEQLGIDDESWVMAELVLSQVHAATSLLNDDQFKAHIPTLLELLEPHPLLVSPGVAQIIRRYAQCERQEEHSMLRDSAFRIWNSPRLDANKPLWNEHVGEQARAMVELWMKRCSIRDFFELLQADGKADHDRKDFWLPYAEAIDDVWFALGYNSRTNNKADYRRIRQQMAGRWMELDGPNQKQDNALLMKIGDHLVIEFARENNACHVFDARHMPFVLGQRSVLGTQEGLKNTEHVGHRRKLMHRQDWTHDFANYLRWNLGVSPGAEKKPARPTSIQRSPSPSPAGRTVTMPSSSRAVEAENFKDQAFSLLQKICQAHKVELVDERGISGKVYVRAGLNNQIMRQILVNHGFRFDDEATGWSRTWR